VFPGTGAETMTSAAGALREAFELYRSLVTTHPYSAEAGYCQAQILNIVNAVAP
jgi:hypothetical protein